MVTPPSTLVAAEIGGDKQLADRSDAEHVLSMNRFWRTSSSLVRKHLPADALKSYNATLAFS